MNILRGFPANRRIRKLTGDQSVTRSLRTEKEGAMGTPTASKDCCMVEP
jgi:hypothetical protein